MLESSEGEGGHFQQDPQSSRWQRRCHQEILEGNKCRESVQINKLLYAIVACIQDTKPQTHRWFKKSKTTNLIHVSGCTNKMANPPLPFIHYMVEALTPSIKSNLNQVIT